MRALISFFAAFILLASPFGTGAQAFGQESGASLKLKTVVIDPGHGGKDPGCIRGGVYEKDIVLSIALKLGKMIQDSLPGVKVIYTRSDDRFIELQERAGIANRNNADLFLSIHINANRSSSPHGSETFCMGLNMSDENMEVCQMENSVITLEDDYSSKYEGFDPKSPESYIIFSLLQNAHLEQSLKFAENIQKISAGGPVSNNRGVRQAGFVVLWRCTSPAVLTELGFLTNDEDFKILSNKRYHSALAGNLFKAVRMYRDCYEFSSEPTAGRVLTEPSSTQEHNTETTTTKVNGKYAIQVLSSSELIKLNDRQLKGLDCYVVDINSRYKYVTGRFMTKEEAERALPEVKKLFHDAYIINIPNSTTE